MRRRAFLKLMGAAAAGVGFAGWGAFRVSESITFAAQGPDNISSLIAPIRAAHRVPALTAAFVRGGDVAAIGTVGVRANGFASEATSNDLWHLGSCTKSMTATLFAALIEQGRLSWDTTVADVFSDEFEFLPDYATITPVELLTHRSGMAGVAHPSAYDPLQIALVTELYRSGDSVQTQRLDFARQVLNHTPVTTPGTAHDYSNFGYMVAGAMLETITGQSWESLMLENLFAPLGMAQAGFGAPGASTTSPDQPWSHVGEQCTAVAPGINADNPAAYGPAGTVHASLEGWAKYAGLHLNDINHAPTPILNPESIAFLQADQFRQDYSFGWVVTSRGWAGGTALHHTGSNTMWFANLWLAPARNAALMAVTNCASRNAFAATDAVMVELINKYLV